MGKDFKRWKEWKAKRGQPTEAEFWANTTRSAAPYGHLDECWLWAGCVVPKPDGSPGYPYVWWNGKPCRAHRVAYELSTGLSAPRRGSSMCVMHRCDRPTCINPAHLRLGTKRDNSVDMALKGRAGVGQPQKLTEDRVKAIICALAAGCPQRPLAETFGVTTDTISRIANGKSWQHVE